MLLDNSNQKWVGKERICQVFSCRQKKWRRETKNASIYYSGRLEWSYRDAECRSAKKLGVACVATLNLWFFGCCFETYRVFCSDIIFHRLVLYPFIAVRLVSSCYYSLSDSLNSWRHSDRRTDSHAANG